MQKGILLGSHFFGFDGQYFFFIGCGFIELGDLGHGHREVLFRLGARWHGFGGAAELLGGEVVPLLSVVDHTEVIPGGAEAGVGVDGGFEGEFCLVEFAVFHQIKCFGVQVAGGLSVTVGAGDFRAAVGPDGYFGALTAREGHRANDNNVSKRF